MKEIQELEGGCSVAGPYWSRDGHEKVTGVDKRLISGLQIALRVHS